MELVRDIIENYGMDAVPAPDTTFPVFVKNLRGKTATILIKADDPISDIRAVIADKCEVDDASELRLIFQGKQLEDGRLVSDYWIQKESCIHTARR